MESIGLLIGLIIKYGILIISLIGLRRIWVLRKDKKRHYLTIIITTLFIVLTFRVFFGSYEGDKSIREEISGNYKLTYYKCEKCPECVVKLDKNGTYILLKNDKQIDKGNWDYHKQIETIFLNIENGSSNEILDSTRTLSYIGNKNCQEYWRNQNLKIKFEGTILRIDTTYSTYGVYSFLLKDNYTHKEFLYEPKYIRHPWLNDKITIGDFIKKEENSMKFLIIKKNKDTFEVNER